MEIWVGNGAKRLLIDAARVVRRTGSQAGRDASERYARTKRGANAARSILLYCGP